MYKTPPPQLGRYRLIRQIGAGGLARVYLARHPAYGQVALKLPLPLIERMREPERRFQSEARLLRQLRHPNILRMIETGIVRLPGGEIQYYIATEYLPDGSLADLLARSGGRLPERHAVQLAVQIADALAYAHDHGVIHRDIKPSNLLLRGPACVVLADFGIARSLAEQAITRDNSVLGTLAYMSPEQTLGNRDLVRRGSDIYSFGVVLYEMLSGHQPRNNPNLPDLVVVQMIQQQPLPPLAQAAPQVSPDLSAIAHRCLQTNRAQRYTTMSAVAADLRRMAARYGYVIQRSAHTPRSGERRSPPWAMIVGVGGIIVLAFFIVALLSIAQTTAPGTRLIP
ncbi:MAG: serine/threonine-protein kinase [Chloroflexales bacterium]